MIFTKTAIKAFTFLALVGSAHSAKNEAERKAPVARTDSYLLSFYTSTASSNDVSNAMLTQSNTVSSIHEINENITEVTVGDQESLAELIAALPNGTVVEKNYNMTVLGWKDKDQDSGSFRGRKLAEEKPYGLPMVEVDLFYEVDGIPPLPPPTGKIKVCVVDTGYALEHQDLPNKQNMPELDGYDQYGDKWDVDGHGHGSHCAGTIGAIGDNDVGVTSCNPDPDKFSFYIGKGLSDSGSGSGGGVLAAVEACVANGAKVVSMSLGGGSPTTAALSAYRNHYNNGTLIIAAAGNGGNGDKMYPASYPFIMSVAAVDSNKNKAGFSQYNDQVEIAAPGVAVKSTLPNNKYASWSGTSMACPHVAGVAALVWSYFPECENSQIRNVLLKSADRSMNEDNVCDEKYGHGIVKAKAAYDLLATEGCNAGGPAHGGSQADFSFGGCEQIMPGDSFPPTPSPTPCTGLPLTLNLKTDKYGSETSWEVKHIGGGEQLQGNGYNGTEIYNEEHCLQPSSSGECEFTIKDSDGDGICCVYGQGSYEVKLNNKQVASGGEFLASESTTFDCGLSNTEAPVSSPASTSPTNSPVSTSPTEAPVSTNPTGAPISTGPTDAPVSAGPTDAPASAGPTDAPVSAGPTESPISDGPTNSPVSTGPTDSPVSANPTGSPVSAAPTDGPISTSPTDSPVTDGPTEAPVSATPTDAPVVGPSAAPISAGPSDAPVSAVPTESPISTTPTDSPISETPTDAPVSTTPTGAPVTATPTDAPVSATPTESPVTSSPVTPTVTPTDAPISASPTDAPASAIPTNAPVSGSPIVAPNCPPAFSNSIQYSAGDEVTVENKIYKCKPFPYTGWCSQAGYQPGASAHWNMAWTRNGDCNAQPPVSSPTCPPSFSASETYAANDRVSVNKNIYKCKAFPASQWCDMAGYEPGTSLYWTNAWNRNGVCPNDDSNYVRFIKFTIQLKKKKGQTKPILRFYVRNEENTKVTNAKIVVAYTPDVGNVVERGCTSNSNGLCKVTPPFFSAQASSVSVKLISVVSSFGDINLDENIELDGCPLFSDACTEVPIPF